MWENHKLNVRFSGLFTPAMRIVEKMKNIASLTNICKWEAEEGPPGKKRDVVEHKLLNLMSFQYCKSK